MLFGNRDRDRRFEIVQKWTHARRIMVNPPVVNPSTRTEMQRGAEKTGQPDPFDPHAPVTVWCGGMIVMFEELSVFPSEQMIARIGLALEAGMDEQKGE